MKCPRCDKDHEDWEKVGEHAVDGPYHAGIVITAECGHCGETIEGGKA